MALELAKLKEISGMSELSNALFVAEDVVTKEYLYRLNACEIVEMPEELRDLEITDYLRLSKIEKIVMDNNENMVEKLATVLGAAYTSKATVVSLIKGTNATTELYVGVMSKEVSRETVDVSTLNDTFQGALKGNFQGIVLKNLKNNDIKNLTRSVFKGEYVTAISGIPSLRDGELEIESYVQGIEHVVDSLKGREYSIISIMDPLDENSIVLARKGYEDLYTQLSPFQKGIFSINETESMAYTDSYTTTLSKTVGMSTAITQNYSKTCGWSETNTYGNSNTVNKGQVLSDIGKLAGGALGMKGGPLGVLAGGMALGTACNIAGTLIGSDAVSVNDSKATQGSRTAGIGRTEGHNESEGKQESEGESTTSSSTQGSSVQVESENRSVQELLARINKNIGRIEKCEAFGAFNASTYVISPNPDTNAIAANGYSALMKGKNSYLQTSAINQWEEMEDAEKIKGYLERFSHPCFYNNLNRQIIVTPASLVNSYEGAICLGFPKKSLDGVPVIQNASFGRNIYTLQGEKTKDSKKIKLGTVFHMGCSEPDTKVTLDLESLSMHTFVTGSTGTGKTTAIYTILDKLMECKVKGNPSENIKFMVIEPAKGEYKNRFGNYPNVKVYGTNRKKMPLLRINPFSFPEDVHVLEHIDRLIEIFNVCWPMYAAMPAVLKDSVERAYVSSGWDLDTSECKYIDSHGMNLYPSFSDVLLQINTVMEESQYSSDSKGDYKGALCTRIKSLTNGLYGQIFTNNELTSEELFENNVVVDLSRTGSMETKALIMGLLVMKLQEHRMSSSVGVNCPLKHVTVLEEAHNLLKRTSTEQSTESSNLMGKSVEMLANSIAEMRTYGEGFVIVDQAPQLMDLSVIRNTNTKIILRLPDYSDRELVGRAANLDDKQIIELSRLKIFVGAVYQNNWLEPVLCDIEVDFKENETYSYIPEEIHEVVEKERYIDYILTPLGKRRQLDGKYVQRLKDDVFHLAIPADSKIAFLKYIDAQEKEEVQRLRGKIVYSLFNSETAFALSKSRENIHSWYKYMCEVLEPNLSLFSEADQQKIVAVLTREKAERDGKKESYELFEKLMKYM